MTTAVLTTVISFASTVIARHAGIRGIGILAVVGLLMGLISALFFLPAMMQVLFARFPLSDSKEPKENAHTNP